MSPADRRRRRPTQFGILLIDKPAGPTSFDVVGWVRWALHERTVGHCGTLDPGASGLLVVCVGEATKLVEYLTDEDKRYLARISLGRSTTTADADGDTLDTVEVPPGAEARAEVILRSLVGPLELSPPAYSAVKLDGKRAHELARAGKGVDLPPRPMALHAIEIIGHGREPNGDVWIEADLSVAKGTYVRSLAQELGRRMDLPAHLASLRRIGAGRLRVDDPKTVRGLVPIQLPDIDGRPPKWRVQLPGTEQGTTEEEQRAYAGAHLRSHLSKPWERLPFDVSELPSAGPHERLMVRMIQGQRLGATPSNCEALGIVDRDGLWVLVDRAAGQMMLLRCEPADGGSGRRLAPTRVLRFPPDPGPDPESTPSH